MVFQTSIIALTAITKMHLNILSFLLFLSVCILVRLNLKPVLLKIKKKIQRKLHSVIKYNIFFRFQHSGSAVIIHFSEFNIDTENQHPQSQITALQVSLCTHKQWQHKQTTTLHTGFGGNQQPEQHYPEMKANEETFFSFYLILEQGGKIEKAEVPQVTKSGKGAAYYH